MTTPPPPQAPDGQYAVTPLELFFDLVFVFAVAQLSRHLLAQLSWRGVAETLVLLLAVLTVWSYTSWAVTTIPADAPRTRRMVLAVMLLGLFMNAAVTGAFGRSGWAFVIPLLLIQLGRAAWMVATARDAAYRDPYVRVLLWFVATAPLWAAGAVATPASRLLWWALAAGVELSGTALAHPVPGRRPHAASVSFAGGHMLERCRLLLIIALGETVLTTGAAIAAAPLTPMTVITGAAALAGTVALWAIAFGRAARLTMQHMEETGDPIRASRHAVNALLAMVAGLVAVAVANEAVIAHPHGPASAVVRALLSGGPALFLLAQGWYVWTVLRVRPRMYLLGGAAVALAGLAAVPAPPYVALILTGASLAAIAMLDRP